MQQRVGDLVTLCQVAIPGKTQAPAFLRPILIGNGPAGLWSLLAAPAAEAVVADCSGVNAQDEQALLAADLFCPGLLSMGGFEGAAALAAPHPVLLHNAGPQFGTKTLRNAYQSGASGRGVRIEHSQLPDDQLVHWVVGLD